MQRHRHLLAGFLLVITAAAAAELPPPPAGFAWERFKEIKAAVLRPTGWTLKHERKGDSETYSLNAPKAGVAAGPNFALNWVPDVPGKAKMTPSKYAAALADVAAENHRLLDRATGERDGLATLSFRFTDNSAGHEGTMTRYQFFANDRTGSLYVVAFEAPAGDWESAGKTAAVMLESLRLDPAQ